MPHHFFRLAPELSEYFPACNHLRIEPFTVQEIVYQILDELNMQSLVLSEPAAGALVNGIRAVCNNQVVANWSKNLVHEFVWEGIIYTKHKHIMEMPPSEQEITVDALLTIHPEDIDFGFFKTAKKELTHQMTDQVSLQALFDSSMSALQAMIGLEPIKKNLTTTLNLVRFNENRKALGLKVDQTHVHHMIFTGNPGTGKTTVAKLIGKIYHSLGMLSKGDVIVTERSKIVGRYIGTTEENMTKLLAEAKGNVLFIDEAYTLFTGEQEDNRDFGLRVIESLLTVLAEDNSDMIVILAGYEKEMNKMLQYNQGLKGRFPHHFHFDDYTVNELSQIGNDYLCQYDYTLTDKALEVLLQYITDTVARKDPAFSNARWMRRLITHGIVPEMARRIMTNNLSPDKSCYQTIEADDVVSAISLINENSRQAQPIRKKLGFIA